MDNSEKVKAKNNWSTKTSSVKRGAILTFSMVVFGVATLAWSQAAVPGTTIWPPEARPANLISNNSQPAELGTRFKVNKPGIITAIRFYKSQGNINIQEGTLWKADGTKLTTAQFNPESIGGWQEARLERPVRVSAGSSFIVSYYSPQGAYASTVDYFSKDQGNDYLMAPNASVGGGNGAIRQGKGFPSQNANGINYWVDVRFIPDA